MKEIVERCGRNPISRKGIMLTGKVYRSIGVILVLGGVLYLFMATRINRGEVLSDVVLFQPVPTETTREKTQKSISVKTHHLHLTSKNDALLTKPADKNLNPIKVTSTVVDNRLNKPPIDPPNISKLYKTDSDNSLKNPKETKMTIGRPANITANLETLDHSVIDKKPTILSDKKIIIIVAYMRTGSTLTASLFQEYPNTFYVFEPIRSVNTKFREAKTNNLTKTLLHYIHGREKNYTFSEKTNVFVDEVNSWLTCKLDAISRESLRDDFHRHYTKIMKLFYYCSHGVMSSNASPAAKKLFAARSRVHPRLRQYYERTRNIDTCLKKTIYSCQKSTVRVLKFIRLRMKEVEKILPLYPNMKIIHLVRDPRAILNSRLKVHAIKPSIYKANVDDLCIMLQEDLRYTKRILQNHPDKLRVVYYEDMAEHPMETARSLLDYTGLEFTKHMQDYMMKQTHSSRDSCAYCTQRQDSNATAHKWRTQLDPKNANYIFEKCKLSSGVLGYLPFTNVADLRNKDIASRKVLDVYEELLNNGNF